MRPFDVYPLEYTTGGYFHTEFGPMPSFASREVRVGIVVWEDRSREWKNSLILKAMRALNVGTRILVTRQRGDDQ